MLLYDIGVPVLRGIACGKKAASYQECIVNHFSFPLRFFIIAYFFCIAITSANPSVQ